MELRELNVGDRFALPGGSGAQWTVEDKADGRVTVSAPHLPEARSWLPDMTVEKLAVAAAHPGKVAVVDELPPCDFCGEEGKVVEARFDFRTLNGAWANGCRPHFSALALEAHQLGRGVAQYLVRQSEVDAGDALPVFVGAWLEEVPA